MRTILLHVGLFANSYIKKERIFENRNECIYDCYVWFMSPTLETLEGHIALAYSVGG